LHGAGILCGAIDVGKNRCLNPTEVGSGAWEYSVLIWVISTAIFSNAIAHR